MASERDVEIALCVFREANDALIVFEPRDRRVVDLNPTFLRLTGFERKAALTMKVGDLLSSAVPDEFRRLVAAFQQTSFFHAREGFLLARNEGPPISVSVSVSRIHTRPEPLGLAIIRDISERKRVEAELERSRRDLEARVIERTATLSEAVLALREEIAGRLLVEADLRRANEAAEAAGRVKDRFLAVLSHELRTPLTPVLAVVSALLDQDTAPAGLRPTLEMIRRNITLEARLIDDLLDVMRSERGKFRLSPEPADAHALIHEAIEICRPEIEESGARIGLDLAAPDHRIEADPTRVHQVVWNLIKNAVKCSEPGGTIAVSTRNEGGRLVVSVRDEGMGIEPEILPKIFEAFEQGTTPLRRRVGGLGLGLSVSRTIVEAHGGRLAAVSGGTGCGATFTFDLPLSRAPDSAPETRPAPPPEAPGRGLDVLLVEDNKDVLRYYKMVLEMRGHRVTAAANLATAREELGRRLDILISDIELPDGSGLDLMRELRGQVVGIAISGFGTADDVRESLEAGFALHLIKPIEAGRLEAAVREVTATAATGRPPA